MKTLIIGSGIAGLSCAISLAKQGLPSIFVSPFPSERAQSVMAAGGINAVDGGNSDDSLASHIEDTLRGGRDIAGRNAVTGLCEAAPRIVRELEEIGCVFTRDAQGHLARRNFGGQSHPRTCFCGASTGKQIVSALVMECRKYEAQGLITRRYWTDFHSALLTDGVCHGALLYDESTMTLYPQLADAVVIATGGMNALFGKTTGTTSNDGYAAGRLFMQGAALKNPEFIQYHPTTMETAQKRMLISEAARGEGGRLFYEENGARVYFMEERFGANGNLMPRDVVARCMEETGRQVFLDLTFLGKEQIDARLPEVRELCQKYRGIDITKEVIPVAPGVHFFMGGLAVKRTHETNLQRLYAIGECASLYHGANRLGGNSLLAAIYSGQVAAKEIGACTALQHTDDFATFAAQETQAMKTAADTESRFPVMYIRDMLAENMQMQLGLSRSEDKLLQGIRDIDFYLEIADKIHYDRSVLAYFHYSLKGILNLAKATLMSANERKESRGAHYRSDYPEENENYRVASILSFAQGDIRVRYDKEGHYEN